MFDNSVTLYSVPFDNTYGDNILFETRAAQKAWFTKQQSTPARNPVSMDYGTGVSFSVTVFSEASVYTTLNRNYIALRLLSSDEPIEYVYAFITNAKYISAQTYLFYCEVDVIQTYLRDITFERANILRAHLPRFTSILPQLYRFNIDRDSQLFLSEGFNPILYKRDEVKVPLNLIWQDIEKITKKGQIYTPDSDTRPILDFINENYIGHIYVLFDETHKYDGFEYFDLCDWINATDTGRGTILDYEDHVYGTRLACLWIPIPRNKNVKTNIIPAGTASKFSYTWDDVYRSFISKNAPYIYGVFCSPICLINLIPNAKNHITVDTSTKTKTLTLLDTTDTDLNYRIKKSPISGTPTAAVVECLGFPVNPLISDGGIDFPSYTGRLGLALDTYPNILIQGATDPDGNILPGAKRDMKYNPKLYSREFMDILLFDFSGNSWEYDIRMLGTSKPELIINVSMQPSFATIYSRLINRGATGRASEVQNSLYWYDYSGIVSGADTSLPYATEAYAEFLAQNKNFYQMNKENIQTQAAKNFLGVAGSAAMVATGQAQAVPALVSAGQAAITTANQFAQLDYKINNLENAPSNIANVSNNAFIWFGNPNGMAFRAVFECALEEDMRRADDFMYLYGFRCDHIDDMLKTMTYRQIFNYVQAEVNNLNTPYGLSNTMKTKIRNVFRNGIRLWRDTQYMFDLTYENWEGTPLTAYPEENAI